MRQRNRIKCLALQMVISDIIILIIAFTVYGWGKAFVVYLCVMPAGTILFIIVLYVFRSNKND
jgi:hypothetical protein